MKVKASYTVEAALLCPFLCLMLCGMIIMTLHLYNKVEWYSSQLESRVERGISSAELIRLEAVVEERLWR